MKNLVKSREIFHARLGVSIFSADTERRDYNGSIMWSFAFSRTYSGLLCRGINAVARKVQRASEIFNLREKC